MKERRKRTEYAPRRVENSVSKETFEAYLAAREKALHEERAEAKENDS